jgi:hypothetical protein
MPSGDGKCLYGVGFMRRYSVLSEGGEEGDDAALALNCGATWPGGKRFCKAKASAPQGDLYSSENLRLNKKCFNQALFPTGLMPVTKSDNAESPY